MLAMPARKGNLHPLSSASLFEVCPYPGATPYALYAMRVRNSNLSLIAVLQPATLLNVS